MVQIRTRKIASEIYWPLAHKNYETALCVTAQLLLHKKQAKFEAFSFCFSCGLWKMGWFYWSINLILWLYISLHYFWFFEKIILSNKMNVRNLYFRREINLLVLIYLEHTMTSQKLVEWLLSLFCQFPHLHSILYQTFSIFRWVDTGHTMTDDILFLATCRYVWLDA